MLIPLPLSLSLSLCAKGSKVKFVITAKRRLGEARRAGRLGEVGLFNECTMARRTIPAPDRQVRRKTLPNRPPCSRTAEGQRAPPSARAARPGGPGGRPWESRANCTWQGQCQGGSVFLRSGQCDKDTMCPPVTRGSKPKPPSWQCNTPSYPGAVSAEPENAGGTGACPAAAKFFTAPIQGHFLS